MYLDSVKNLGEIFESFVFFSKFRCLRGQFLMAIFRFCAVLGVMEKQLTSENECICLGRKLSREALLVRPPAQRPGWGGQT